MTTRQWVGVAVGLLVVGGVIGAGVGRAGSAAVVRRTGQTDVGEAYVLFHQADHELALGHPRNAQSAASEAAGWLFSAVTPLQAMGMGDASGLTTYLQGAEWDFVRGRASAHEQAVLRTFRHVMAPLAHENVGQIPDATFQAALNQVQSAIGR